MSKKKYSEVYQVPQQVKLIIQMSVQIYSCTTSTQYCTVQYLFRPIQVTFQDAIPPYPVNKQLSL